MKTSPWCILNHSSPLAFFFSTPKHKTDQVMLFLKLMIFHLFFLTFFNYYSITYASNNLEYLKHTCSSNKTFPTNSTYRSNLHTLLTSLSSRAATAEFYNATATATATETIYGMFMCRGDITNNQTCQKCIAMAAQQIASYCPNSKEAIIWFHECLVRYSNRSFFSTVDKWPRLNSVSYNVTTNLTKEGSYGWLLASTLNDAIVEAANTTKRFATKHVRLEGSNHNVYTLVQCTPDLSSRDCSSCLDDIMRDIPLCCLGRDGGMVLYPSCSLMFGLHHHFTRGVGVNVDDDDARRHPLPTSFVTDELALSGNVSGLVS